MRKSRGFFFLGIFLLLLPGCATLGSSFNPQVTADEIASRSGFIKEIIPTRVFRLTSYTRLDKPGKPITVYIEGDGRAWLSRTRISEDPTPMHPLMLELAATDPSNNVVYLARPCQYDSSAIQSPCGPEYWSNKRFSEEVIASTDQAIDVLAKRMNTPDIRLLGYSGGGSVAVLVASRRTDVSSLRTIAGNLDPEAVNAHHRADPLIGSLDPLKEASKLSKTPQRHFIGSDDSVVPSFIVQNYIRESGNDRCIQVTKVSGATHHSGWKERWGELLKLPAVCE